MYVQSNDIFIRKFNLFHYLVLSIAKYWLLYYLCRRFKVRNMEKAESTIAQMRKGVLEMCVLAAISSKESYASDILVTLKQSQLIVVEGTLYPILTRLKNEGFLSYRWEESTSGPPRKYYTITPAGAAFLDELRLGWEELNSAVSKIFLKEMDSEPSK